MKTTNIINIDPDKITYDDAKRMRTDLDPKGIEELASSIKAVGLINPIIIEDNFELKAGRRRLAAVKLLGWTKVAIRMFSDLTPLERVLIEYDENVRRKQMTWQEEANAIAIIHKLLQDESPHGTWDAKKTAEKVGLSHAKVVEDLQLSTAMIKFENVTKRPSKKGALQAMHRSRELELQQELARRRAFNVGLDISGAQQSRGVIYYGDCRDILAKLTPESVDLIITDPPWGIDFDASSIWTKDYSKTYEDSPDEVAKMMDDVVPLMFRVMKECCHFYCYFPIQMLNQWAERFVKAGFHVRVRPLVWLKVGSQTITDTASTFLPSYETILFGWKPGPSGIRRLLSRATPEGFAAPRQETIYHPNEKPSLITEQLIEASSAQEEIIVDPFTGGGSIIAAAYKTGRYYIGIEKDETYFNVAKDRITALEESEGDDPDKETE